MRPFPFFTLNPAMSGHDFISGELDYDDALTPFLKSPTHRLAGLAGLRKGHACGQVLVANLVDATVGLRFGVRSLQKCNSS